MTLDTERAIYAAIGGLVCVLAARAFNYDSSAASLVGAAMGNYYFDHEKKINQKLKEIKDDVSIGSHPGIGSIRLTRIG